MTSRSGADGAGVAAQRTVCRRAGGPGSVGRRASTSSDVCRGGRRRRTVVAPAGFILHVRKPRPREGATSPCLTVSLELEPVAAGPQPCALSAARMWKNHPS